MQESLGDSACANARTGMQEGLQEHNPSLTHTCTHRSEHAHAWRSVRPMRPRCFKAPPTSRATEQLLYARPRCACLSLKLMHWAVYATHHAGAVLGPGSVMT